MTTIYELGLNVLPGTLVRKDIVNIDIKLETYHAKFLVKKYEKENGSYVVFYCISDIMLKCGIFNSLLECTMYINKAMKIAMRGLFVFKVCSTCLRKIYFPEDLCEKCDIFSFVRFGGFNGKWYIERKIENLSEHMSLSKNDNKNCRANSIRSSIKEFKELLHL